MSPVVRITKELFRRLQAYGRPLVDTPSSVIERVLDAYEAKVPESPVGTTGSARIATDSSLASGAAPQLFLAPASGENLRATIARPASFHAVRSALTESEAQRIEHMLGGQDSLRCWAMTESRRGVWSSMRTGDVVLLTEKNSGRFSYRGTIVGRIDSQRLGDALWSVVPGKPWNLIYVLTDVRPVDIPKSHLVSALGFDPDFRVPGIIRVDERRLKPALGLVGSLDAFLVSVAR